jgi:hypothetical protein
MKKRVSNLRSLLLLLLLITVVSFSLSAQEAKKTYSEAYDVTKGVTLSSDTKYSDIELLTWEKNVVDILVEVEVEASSKGNAEEKMEAIDVNISKSGNTISLETEFEEGWSRNAKIDIQITIKAPAYLNLNMESAYGDLFIQELTGLVLVDLKYGNLKAGTLSRGNEKPYNKLGLSYSNASVETAGWMEVELAYSELDIGTSSMLFVDSKYSKLLGEKTGGIVTEGAYDKYTFDEVDNFVGELRYSGIKFGALTKKFSVESKYTNMKIEHLSKDFKEVHAVLSYGNITMDVEEGASFKVEAEARYGSVNIAQDGKLSKSKENNIVKIWGNVGSDPKGSIAVETRYGNIDIE